MKIDNLSLIELREYVESIGEKSFRGTQLYKWMFAKSVFDFDQMTDMSKSFREKMKQEWSFTNISIKAVKTSKKDNSAKFLFELEDGHFIESVILVDGERYTACISSQVGCKMGCTFCNTAQIGFIRNLTSAEMIKQVTELNRYLDEKFEKKLTNLVFMGMGEPLDNYDNLVKALDILMDESGLNFSHRKITVSTSGLVPEMVRFVERDKAPNMALSLNAVDDKTRSKTMPINNKYNISDIVSAIKNLTLDRRKRITIEYVLLSGVNDSMEDARKLVKLMKNLPVKINLIPYNQTEGLDMTSTTREQLEKFQNVLVETGISCFIRKSLGSDIDGACGQLYAGYLDQTGDI